LFRLKIKSVATRCQILRLKCTKFYFRWGSAPDPAGGAYSPYLDLRGPTSNGRGREGRRGEKGEWNERDERRGREREEGRGNVTTQHTQRTFASADLLRTSYGETGVVDFGIKSSSSYRIV